MRDDQPATAVGQAIRVEVWLMPGFLDVKARHVQVAWDRCATAGTEWAMSDKAAVGVSAANVGHGRRIAVVHVPQEWPHGVVCRNCHANFPCAAAQWAFEVLRGAGWDVSDLFDLLETNECGAGS